ncbi:MAG: hypothetical protein K2J65_08035 [Duncaniella sp.]|nr:hypothetical protein [Duncaniella sp.]
MKKQILTDLETKNFLMKAFKCSRMAVWRALNFDRDTEQARRIRVLALKRGGKLTEGYIPDCETSYETAEKTMTQKFGKRVKLVADRKSGEVTVWVDGERHGDIYRDLSVPDLMQLQYETEQLAKVL